MADIYVADNTHTHAYMEWVTFHRAPTGPFPEHTSFVVLLCPTCGAWATFPESNFKLCTEEFRTLLETLATSAGFFLAHGQAHGGQAPPG